MEKIFQRRIFLVMLLIILTFWIIGSLIPTNSCYQKDYTAFHWDSCENMGPLTNVLYVTFQIITLAGTVYLIVGAIIFLEQKPK